MSNQISKLSSAFCLFSLTFLFFGLLASSTKAITLPAGFEDALVADIGSPTALAFTPDGRLLVTTQQGQVRVYQNGALLGTPAFSFLSSKICTNSERGLLGIAVDPNFATNSYVYFYYTFNNNGTCVNRVARFVLANDNTIATTSETVLIDKIHSPAGNHNGGDLHFGKDGLLYISVGDGGCDYANNSGCAGANDAARDKHVMLGKILRITRDGAIPATNPYQGAGTGRCNVTGSTTAGNWCQETFASGLRNPFRIAFDSNAVGTRFFINDVGQNVWEEIDEGINGADYGWNAREGHCANNSTSNCGTVAGFTNPVYDYQHTGDCSASGVRGNSITGGAFVPNGVWSSAYDNAYLFGEYVCGKIFKMTPNGTGGYAASEFATGLGGGSAVAMIFGPFQTTKALYYTTYAVGGQVRRIRYTGQANRNPVAAFTANPTSGAAPLDVQFNASTSSDPDGDTLSYSWNFGDGTTGTGATPAHRYTTNGTYMATLTVSDGRGGTNSTTMSIDVGNTAPQLTIISPTASQLFRVGETITLRGSATDAQDGTLADSRLTWEVLLHHNNNHTHPYLSATTGNNITFTAPAPEDLDAATGSFLEIRLTATDSNGLSTTIVQYFQPRKVNTTFNTNPSGLNLTVNGTTVVGSTTVVSWDGYVLNVSAPNQTGSNGQQYTFQSWSDGGTATHTIVTPAAAATFTATFQGSGYSISGVVRYGITPTGGATKYVSGVSVNASGTSAASAMSSSAGSYQLTGLINGGTYLVTPSKAAQTDTNGISLQDASEAAKIAFNQITSTTNQRIAADATGDGSVSLQDASEIAKRAFNITSNNMVGQWKFVPPQKTYPSLTASLSGEDYEAVLVGDVTGNWTAAAAASAPSAVVGESSALASEEVAEEQVKEAEEQVIEQVKEAAAAAAVVVDEKDEVATLGSEQPQQQQQQQQQSPLQSSLWSPSKEAVSVGGIPVSLPIQRAEAGTTILIPVTVGNLSGLNITSYDFIVSYNPAVLQPANPAFETNGTLTGNAGGYTVLVDPQQPTGRLRIGAFGTTPLAGSGVLINLRFTVLPGAAITNTPLSFVSFVFGEPSTAPPTTLTNGSFTRTVPTAAQVTVSGRVTTHTGRGIRNVVVTMTDGNGRQRQARTTSFGYYQFTDVAVGQTYSFTAVGKRFSFGQNTVVRSVTETTENINFVALDELLPATN